MCLRYMGSVNACLRHFDLSRLDMLLRWLLIFLYGSHFVEVTPIVLELVIYVFPDAIRISCEIVLSPDEICRLYSQFFILVRDFFPLAQVIFKLSFDQFGIVAREHAKLQFGRAKVALDDLIHNKLFLLLFI